MRALVLWWLGCGEPARDLAVDPGRAEAEAVAVAAPRPPADATPGAPVEVVLVWQGVGDLHRGFFSDPEAAGLLARGLSGAVTGPANVYVRYDGAAFSGQIRLQLRPGTLLLPVEGDGELVDLQALSPITRALAAYRSNVAGRFDLRVESFAVGIESVRGTHACVFGVAGDPPPDGSVVSPCAEVDGRRVCGEPGPAGVRFDPELAAVVRGCLR